MTSETVVLSVPIQIKYKKGQKTRCLKALKSHLHDFFPASGGCLNCNWEYKTKGRSLTCFTAFQK